MGRWQDAADSIAPSRRSECGLASLLASLDADERSELEGIIRHAVATIPSGMGRYSYIHDVIVSGGGPDINTQSISSHLRGVDKCPAS